MSVILLVEDNPDDVLLTQRAFQKSKIKNEIVVVGDGIAALDYLFGQGQYEGQNQRPILILLDINLPRMNGLDVLREVRSDDRTKLIPVVVLTTSKEQEDLIRSYSLGANSYIRKPVDFQQFADAIEKIGFYWLVLNEYPPDS